MEAMILAAGLGTRLGEITLSTPKALIPVAGVPMLERVALRLLAVGVDRLIINTHPHADQVVDFVRSRGGFGVDVRFSHEPERPLETGGAVRKAADLFAGSAPFFLHNVDILTDLLLDRFYECHGRGNALATLAVMRRQSSRYLLFDDDGLFGRVDETKGMRIAVREPRGEEQNLGFAGIHVLAPEFPRMLTEEGAFSILEPYLRLARAGYRIAPFRADEFYWIDIGKPNQLAEANRKLK